MHDVNMDLGNNLVYMPLGSCFIYSFKLIWIPGSRNKIWCMHTYRSN